MLIDNKFIYISLPRCASTSFMVSCIKNDISINHFNEKYDEQLKYINNKSNSENLSDILLHAHERCSNLITKFGKHYDIISVKRNRYERFISTWEHIIHELEKMEEYTTSNKFKNFDENDFFKYESYDVLNDSNLRKYANNFLKNNNIKLSNNNQSYLLNMLYIQLSPLSNWHNHNSNIIWFDFEKLNELEEWVSSKLKKPFKLEKTNSSKHIECNLKLTDTFIKKYDNIYNVYDFKKEEKTLI